MSELGPTLHTERLVLRPPQMGDLDGFAALMADEESARFIGGVMDRATVWRGMATMTGSWALQGFGMFSVFERDGGRWIGRVGPWSPEGWPGTEIGWGLLRDAWGKGYAFEAACACMDWAVDALGWTHLIHTIEPANAPSIRLAERLGSRQEGRTRLPAPISAEVDIYGQTATEWRVRRTSC